MSTTSLQAMLHAFHTCVPCCHDPAIYTLSASAVTISESAPTTGLSALLCPSHTRLNRGIDLSTVGEVTAVRSHKCWLLTCQADDVLIDISHEIGLQPVPPLRVPVGAGEEIADMIRAAVEDAQAYDSGHAPTALTIGR